MPELRTIPDHLVRLHLAAQSPLTSRNPEDGSLRRGNRAVTRDDELNNSVPTSEPPAAVWAATLDISFQRPQITSTATAR